MREVKREGKNVDAQIKIKVWGGHEGRQQTTKMLELSLKGT